MKKSITIALLSAFIINGSAFCLLGNTSFASPEENLPDVNTENNVDSNTISDNDNETAESVIAEDDEMPVPTPNADETKIEVPEEEQRETISESDGSGEMSPMEVIVPIYNYEVDNVVVPTAYAMSLNPYEMPIQMGNGEISTEQVLSWKYGMINKSTTDKIVTITLIVEDLNEDKITFVDSAEAAENADENTYAVYLAVIPAADGGIGIAGASMDKDTSASALSNVDMTEAREQAVALHAGENHIAFKLSKATYDFGERIISISNEKPEGAADEMLELTGLNPDGKSATAFTFRGAMNQKADWGKLINGVKITAVYAYSTATGGEEIVSGTHAMVAVY